LISFYRSTRVILGKGNDFFRFAGKNSGISALPEYFEEVVKDLQNLKKK
jgi:hypothetical protein